MTLLFRKGKNLLCVRSILTSYLDRQITLFPTKFFIIYILIIAAGQGKGSGPRGGAVRLWRRIIIINNNRRDKKIMDLEVICPQCMKEYSDGNLPRLFTICGHTFCEKCLSSLAQEQESGKLLIVCPEDGLEVVLDRVAMLPINKALVNFLEARKNNISTRSMISFKDESFSVPRINRSYQEDEDAEALITAINGKEHSSHQDDNNNSKGECILAPSIATRPSEGDNELCLLHNKQVELICLVDSQRLCSKCALFGQHRGHQFVSLDQVEQGNRKIYETLLEIFDEKAGVLDKMTSKKRKEALLESLTLKSHSLRKEISDKFKRIHDEINKAEKAVFHKLEELEESIERKMKKLLVIDEKTVNIYESWAFTAEKRFNSYESGTHEGLLEFYLSGKNLIESGKDIIEQLKQQEEKSNIEAQKYIDEIGVFFNDGPCLNSIPNIVQLYENEKDCERKMSNAFSQKENTKLFANCEFYEDIKKRVKTQALDDDESLLQVLDEFEHGNSVVLSKILDESLIKQGHEKLTPSRMIKATNSNPPSTKIITRKKTMFTTKESLKEEKGKEEKKEPVMARQTLKKKMRSIKIPEKYEKMLEGLLTDSLDTVDFTNAELGDAISLQICDIVKGSARPKTLKLIRNKITDQGFAKILPLLNNISTLNLSQNLLTQACLNVLSDIRATLPNLKNLILSQNKIAERKCKTVVEKLRKMDLTISI